jgi:hypothetical protein
MNYYDFPAIRAAFASGQSDASLVRRGGCYYRRRGRNYAQMTLLSFLDPAEAWGQLRELSREGAWVAAVHFTTRPPDQIPVKAGPREWIATDFAAQLTEPGRHSKRLRWYARQAEIQTEVSRRESEKVLSEWAVWSRGRLFQVCTGHYLRWLEMYHEGAARCSLIGVRHRGELQGIWGFEQFRDSCAVIVAKHLPSLEGKTLWVLGLSAMGMRTVLCGSLTNQLKKELGLHPVKSWTFDLAALPSWRGSSPGHPREPRRAYSSLFEGLGG